MKKRLLFVLALVLVLTSLTILFAKPKFLQTNSAKDAISTLLQKANTDVIDEDGVMIGNEEEKGIEELIVNDVAKAEWGQPNCHFYVFNTKSHIVLTLGSCSNDYGECEDTYIDKYFIQRINSKFDRKVELETIKKSGRFAELQYADGEYLIWDSTFQRPGVRYNSIFSEKKRLMKIGYIGSKGDYVIKPRFGYVPYHYGSVTNTFSEGLSSVYLNGKWGYINTKGKLVIKPQYKKVTAFCNGIAHVDEGYIDRDGKPTAGSLNKIGNYSEENFIQEAKEKNKLLCVFENEKWGYKDRSGNIVIKPQFDVAYGFSEGLACVEVGGKYGFIDETGKFVVQPKYYFAWRFSEGLAAVIE